LTLNLILEFRLSLSYIDKEEFIMKTTPREKKSPQKRTKKEALKSSPREFKEENKLSVGGDVTQSAVVIGDRNTVQVNTFNEQERKIARDISEANELLDRGQVKQARIILTEIKALKMDFPGVDSAEKKLQTAVRKQRYLGYFYASIFATAIFLFGVNLINKNKQALCETNEKYFLTGILAIAQQQSGNETQLWLGDSNNGLTIKDGKGNVEKAFGKEDLKSSSITALEYDDKRNGMWVGTGGGGLVFIDSSKNIQRRFTMKDGIPGCKITDIVVTQKGIYVTAIAGAGMGFSEDGVKWESYEIPQDYKEKDKFDLYNAVADQDGTVWVGAYQDLYQWDGANWKHYQPESNMPVTVRAIAIDGDSFKWVGTTNGLFLLNSRSGTRWSKSFTTHDGLASNNITSIAVMDEKSAVIGTDNGVSFCQRTGGDLEINCHTDNTDTDLGLINTITVSLDRKTAYLGGTKNDPTTIEPK
jgi:ligand-binding sensor domain-containing protein